jgi:hypothetical protein
LDEEQLLLVQSSDRLRDIQLVQGLRLQAPQAQANGSSPAWRITAMISSTVGGSAG